MAYNCDGRIWAFYSTYLTHEHYHYTLLNVSSDRLVKPGIEPATPGLQGKWIIHYTTVAPILPGSN